MAIFNTVYGGEPKWKPWSNTIVYYPLNWNANDESWNGKNGTASNITWDSWWDNGCAYFNWNAYISIPSLWSTNNNATFSFWVNSNQNVSNWWDFLCINNSSDNEWFTLMNDSRRFDVQTYKSWYSPSNHYSTNNVCDGTWHYIAVTVSWTNFSVYIDWTLDITFTWSYWIPSLDVTRMWMHPNWSSNKYTGYIDTLIIEKVCWTADEVANYYNKTKKNYWL